MIAGLSALIRGFMSFQTTFSKKIKRFKMNKIKVYLHSEKFCEPEVIEIEDNSSIKEIIIKHHTLSDKTGTTEQYEIFIEDEDNLKYKDSTCKDAGINNHTHVHCHQCEKVKADLHYNGMIKHVILSPSTTGSKIHTLITKEFPSISELDADNLLLEISKDKYINLNDHVGSFVTYPYCNLNIFLVPKTNIQG